VINPIQTEPTSVNVSAFVNQSHSAALFFVVLSALFAAFFWIITALYTRKTMLWISKKLSSENLFISLQIVMLLLFWLPLTTSFALNNPSHQTEITTIGFGMIVVAGILFTAEDLLRKFWKIEY
jgi:membrane-associated HD superfamily phosphohydrolase